MLKIKEVAHLVGISVRTLHHYDEIGLLIPDETTDAGYRMYSQNNLRDLQQILFFKELDFPLRKIKEIMSDREFDRNEALRMHRRMLIEKQENISKMISTIDRTLEEGDIDMTDKRHFAGFDFSRKDQYEKEARERWGEKTVDEAQAKILGREEKYGEEMNEIYRHLANIRHTSPQSDEAQKAIEQWFHYLNHMGSYSLDAFAGLGDMYVADERFTKNIDQFGEGLAAWMRDAMKAYADNQH